MSAVQGTAEELCAGRGLARELRLPQNEVNISCFMGGKLFLSAGGLLQVYDARTLCYETAMLLPAPVAAIEPDKERVTVYFGSQISSMEIQEGAMG